MRHFRSIVRRADEPGAISATQEASCPLDVSLWLKLSVATTGSPCDLHRAFFTPFSVSGSKRKATWGHVSTTQCETHNKHNIGGSMSPTRSQWLKQSTFGLLLLLICSNCIAAISGAITVYTNRVDLVSNGSYARWISEFQTLHPGTSVKIEGITDYEAAIQKRFESRSYGDVILVPRDIPKQIYPKFFLPLNDLNLADAIYFPTVWEYEGKHFAYTQGVVAEGLVYNKRIFNAANIETPPKTLSEFLSTAEKIKKTGKTPIAMNIGAAWPLQQWEKAVLAIAENGNYFSTMIDDTSPFSPGKPYHSSLKIAHSLFKNELTEPEYILNNWEQSKNDFINGKNAMYFLGNWVIPQLIEAGMKSEDIGFLPFPFDNTGNAKALLTFDWGLAVSRYSKNPDTAKAWITFILTKSNFSDVAGFIPTYKSKNSALPQLNQFMSSKPKIIQASPESNDFIRLTNKAGMDFMGGNYIRNILLSPDFEGSMNYWNKKWHQAKENF